MKKIYGKITALFASLVILFSVGLVAAPAVSAATPNSGPGYTQYWVYRDYCPSGQPYIHRAWYIRTDYNWYYETMYGLRDYDRYDHTDYRVAMYVYNC